MKIASMVGVLMFIGNFVRMLLIDLIFTAGFTGMPSGVTIENYMILNLVTSLALFVAMFVSNFFGSMAPLIAKKMNLDEAAVSAPLITTILDVLIVLLYFGLITIAFVV
jgi:magnesium transporter